MRLRQSVFIRLRNIILPIGPNALQDSFTYSDNTIGVQSKKKAYDLFEAACLILWSLGHDPLQGREWEEYMLRRSFKKCVDRIRLDK